MPPSSDPSAQRLAPPAPTTDADGVDASMDFGVRLADRETVRTNRLRRLVARSKQQAQRPSGAPAASAPQEPDFIAVSNPSAWRANAPRPSDTSGGLGTMGFVLGGVLGLVLGVIVGRMSAPGPADATEPSIAAVAGSDLRQVALAMTSSNSPIARHVFPNGATVYPRAGALGAAVDPRVSVHEVAGQDRTLEVVFQLDGASAQRAVAAPELWAELNSVRLNPCVDQALVRPVATGVALEVTYKASTPERTCAIQWAVDPLIGAPSAPAALPSRGRSPGRPGS